MITVRPVLEIPNRVGFDLWPVSAAEPYTFLALDGHLTPDEVGTAVMALAACNDIDPTDDRPPRPDDPLGSFLHGLLTMDPLFAAGGLQVVDSDTGTRVVPGCCSGLEDRGDWWEVLDGVLPQRGLAMIPRLPPNSTAPSSALPLTPTPTTVNGSRFPQASFVAYWQAQKGILSTSLAWPLVGSPSICRITRSASPMRLFRPWHCPRGTERALGRQSGHLQRSVDCP